MNLAEKVLRAKADYDAVYEAGKAAGGGGSYDEGYSAGYDAGMGEGLEVGRANGLADGKQEAYDTFWDAYQDDGNRTNYVGGFSGVGWTDETFKPKYDTRADNATDMFANCGITDLKGICEHQGVALDFSGATSLLRTFQSAATLTRIGVLDASSAADFRNVFNMCRALQSVERLVLSETTGTQYNAATAFNNCTALTDLTVEGVIWFSLSFQWCPLSRASIESVVAALSGTKTGQTLTLKKSAAEAAFTTEEWETLVATKPNWTIAKA